MLLPLLACVGFDNIPEKPDGKHADPLPDSGTVPDSGTAPTGEDNRAPVADAGPDRVSTVGATVDLDGSASDDPDGDALNFTWKILSRPGGSVAALSDATVESPFFTPDVEGTWTFQLVVDDGELESDADTVNLTAASEGSAPTADAGSDQVVTTGATVYLDGSGSFDPDGDPLSFSWTLTRRPGGSGTVLTSATSATPRFVADVDGVYEASLVVDDGSTSSAADSVVIEAQADSGDSGCGCRGTSAGDLLVGALSGLYLLRPRRRQ